MKLCIFAYTRVTCTFASFTTFVAGAHCVWRLTAASALALPLTCLFLCLLQASTSIHSTAFFAHARFFQTTQDLSLLPIIICRVLSSRNNHPSLVSPTSSCCSAASRGYLNNSLYARRIPSHTDPLEKSARLAIPDCETCVFAFCQDALHNFECQQVRQCSSRSKRRSDHESQRLIMLSGTGGQRLYVLHA